ncbi:MAG: methyltransferase domain-containing protein [Leptolinea sp.]|jgi:cyclopropane fatty-acyl-phospholipid synthase-like methyltransferase|nr:methyltransferase domain-containing protein [Leptolinea sp.]
MNYPRSQSFDPGFVRANMMGPNSMKLLEELSGSLSLQPGMRVLDLACGKGLTSILLAQEFGVSVFATDLWISATENYDRFLRMNLEDRIIPIHAEAHDLPYAENYFDAAVCVDAYQYFGADPAFLDEHLARLVKPGGQIGVAVPGFLQEYGENIPADLQPYIKPEYNFHSCGWWNDLWSSSKLVKITSCRSLDCCKEAWSDWLACDNEYAVADREMIKAEGGMYFNIVGITAERV